MLSPYRAELDLCVREETIITAIKRVAMIGWTPVHHGCIVRVLGEECFRELTKINSSVTGAVVPANEEVELL